VKARLGRLARAVTADSSPSEGDVEIFLDEVSSEVEVALQARGASLPLADDVAAALQGIVADGATLRTISGIYPAGAGKPGGQEAEALMEQVGARWAAAWKAISAGNLPALLLIGQRSSAEADAGSFWTDEGGYGWSESLARATAGWRGDGSLFPSATRDMRF
jgi:hypothetical protein